MLPTGAGTAIITPFTPTGSVDESALRRFVAWQVEEGIDFLVACGSTGEAQTLNVEERERVARITVEAAGGRVPVLAGATDNDTGRAVEEARRMAGTGASGIMSASPYYNKPTQDGLFAHFTAIAEAVELPVLLYNVPGRTSVDLKPETVARLATHQRIGGVKEASGSVRRMLDLRRVLPESFVILSGDDDITIPAIAAGAKGLVSVLSNIMPGEVARMVAAARTGNAEEARTAQLRLLPMIDALFAESNPIPVKTALELMGRSGATVRLPLVPATAGLRDRLAALLRDLGVRHG